MNKLNIIKIKLKFNLLIIILLLPVLILNYINKNGMNGIIVSGERRQKIKSHGPRMWSMIHRQQGLAN